MCIKAPKENQMIQTLVPPLISSTNLKMNQFKRRKATKIATIQLNQNKFNQMILKVNNNRKSHFKCKLKKLKVFKVKLN